jgi:hypothetical protein
MEVKLSALGDGRALPHPVRFIVFISVRGWVDLKAIVVLEVLGKSKQSNNLIGSRTLDLQDAALLQNTKTDV